MGRKGSGQISMKLKTIPEYTKPRDPLFSITDRERVIDQVIRLDAQGHSQLEISQRTGMCPSTVSVTLSKAKEKYYTLQGDAARAALGEKLEQYRMVRAEAWKAWEEAKVIGERVVEELALTTVPLDGVNPKSGFKKLLEKVRETRTREARLPPAQYLMIVIQCLQAESQLLGLIGTGKKAKDGEEGAGMYLAWDKLAAGLDAANPTPDTIEREISSVMGKIDQMIDNQRTGVPVTQGIHAEGILVDGREVAQDRVIDHGSNPTS